MAASELERWIGALSPALRLDVRPEYRAGVKANLEVALKMAGKLASAKLDDKAEPAPVYRP